MLYIILRKNKRSLLHLLCGPFVCTITVTHKTMFKIYCKIWRKQKNKKQRNTNNKRFLRFVCNIIMHIILYNRCSTTLLYYIIVVAHCLLEYFTLASFCDINFQRPCPTYYGTVRNVCVDRIETYHDDDNMDDYCCCSSVKYVNVSRGSSFRVRYSHLLREVNLRKVQRV